MGLPKRVRLCYGFGHILNDLCASMWFTYLLVFFHFVLDFNNSFSGLILLIGQIADAVSTPFVGLQADQEFPFCNFYGRKKTWHIIGTVCVLISFPFIFLPCIECEHSHDNAQLFYYAMFVIIFQFGWASVQVSHLSLIPSIAQTFDDRTELNSIRYAFTVLSNCTIYILTWLVLGYQGTGHNIDRTDAPVFRTVMFTAVGIGALFTLLFHVGVKEKTNGDQEESEHPENPQQQEVMPDTDAEVTPLLAHSMMKPKDWFKEWQFYQVLVLYMATRLFVNLSQVYMPLYLQDTLQMQSQFLAIIPLIMYVVGFVTSTVMKIANRKFGRKFIYTIACFCGGLLSVWFWFGEKIPGCVSWQIYVVACILGGCASTLLITSLSITSDLIGANKESSAFVYGFMSAFDKLSNGAAVMLIQYLNPCSGCCNSCMDYYRYVMSLSCGIPSLLALLAMITLLPVKIGQRRRDRLTVNADYTTTDISTDSTS